MMTPSEISVLLGIDETEFLDDINTLRHPARLAFRRGIAANARELRENVRDAAIAGSPFSIAECQHLIEQQLASII